MGWWRRLAAAVAVVFALLVVPAPAAFARSACQNPPASVPNIPGTPYADALYAPAVLAPLATGAGVRIAVLDSGVQADVPALRDRVATGKDFLRHDPDGRQDCIGHGTEVASLIVGRPVAGSGLVGLAPGATIVPVRVTEQEDQDSGSGNDTQGDHVTLPEFAAAIDWAVDEGRADVINMSLVTTTDDPAVRAAVERAIGKGVVVVAAAGNKGGPNDPNFTPFPAAYPGVIGVGALTSGGVRAFYSQHGDYVDVVAAGDGITAAWPGGGMKVASGTSFAAPFVAATAALIKERFPQASPVEVARRIEATADPAPGGPLSLPSGPAGGGDDAARNPEYGFGLLNPYRALTDTLGPASPAAAQPEVIQAEDPAAAARAARRAESRNSALMTAAVGAAALLVIAVAAIVVRRGRRRGWQPAVPAPVSPASDPDERPRDQARPGQPAHR
jgi:membrane-anchored mycosin MYCP